MQMTSVSPTISLIKLVKQQITMLARSIVREGSCLVGTSGFLLIAIRRSEGMVAALDDWILSGEAQDPKACQRDGSGLTVIRLTVSRIFQKLESRILCSSGTRSARSAVHGYPS